MSLNEIDLGAKMLADLYGHLLVEDQPVESAKRKAGPALKEEQGGGIRYLGKNKKNYCFLVSYQQETFMPDDKMEVLIKIMQACKITMEDIALVNVAGNPGTMETLRAELQPVKMVLLGVTPSEIRLPIQFPPYRPQSYAGCTYLYSESLDGMDNSEAGKKIKTNLWTSLKEMFSL